MVAVRGCRSVGERSSMHPVFLDDKSYHRNTFPNHPPFFSGPRFDLP